MRKAILIVTVLFIAVISTACINNLAVQELNNKARVYMDNGDYDAAINRLEASLDLDNTIFETNYNLGVAYILAKKYKKACKVLDKAITINSDNADAWYSLGIASNAYADELSNMKQKTTVDSEEDEAANSDNEDMNLSEDQRKCKVKEVYDTALKSFNKYLEKNSKANDANDVKKLIEEIQNKVSELGE